jgi:DNA-binding NarL/FixJ family response regulator
VEDPAGALRAVLDLKPDIVVTEIMRAQDLDFIRSLHQQNPHLPILVFSFRDEGWYAAGLKSGGVRLFDEGSDQRRAGARNSHGFERASCSQSNHQGSAL